jgi:hypothetical protein
VVIAGVVAYLTDGKYIDQLHRADVFALYFLALAAAVCLVISTTFLALSLIRRQYDRDALPSEWRKWRETAELRVRQPEYQCSKEQVAEYVSKSTRESIINEMINHTTTNRSLNKKRSRQFNKAMIWLVISLVPVLLEMIMGIVIWLQLRTS